MSSIFFLQITQKLGRVWIVFFCTFSYSSFYFTYFCDTFSSVQKCNAIGATAIPSHIHAAMFLSPKHFYLRSLFLFCLKFAASGIVLCVAAFFLRFVIGYTCLVVDVLHFFYFISRAQRKKFK